MREPKPRFSFNTPNSASEQCEGNPDHIDAADANESWEWIETVLVKLGFLPVKVEMRFSESHLGKVGRFDLLIGEMLEKENLGRWDALRQGNPFTVYFLLHKNALESALSFLKGKLESFELLRLCKIEVAEPAEQAWRAYHLPS